MNLQTNKPFRYLLGLLSETEMDEFEQQYFINDVLFEELSAVENELVDSFVRRELSEMERQEFEEHYLTSPGRHINLRFSEALAACCHAKRAQLAFARERRLFLSFQNRTWRVAWIAVAMVIVLTVTWPSVNWFFRDRSGSTRIQFRKARTPGKLLAPAIVQNGDSAPESPAFQRHYIQPRAATTLLVPGVDRGSENPNQLRLNRSVSIARIMLALEHDNYVRYNVVVKNGERKIVWTKKNLRSTAGSHGTRLVILRLTSTVFTNGDYLITLDGMASDGKSNEIETYLLHASRTYQ